MPDVVRLRNNYGHPVELDHIPGPNPDHGDVIDVPGRLITDEAEYRALMGLKDDVPLGPDVAGYHHVLEPSGQLRGWPADKWDLVADEKPASDNAPDTKAKG